MPHYFGIAALIFLGLIYMAHIAYFQVSQKKIVKPKYIALFERRSLQVRWHHLNSFGKFMCVLIYGYSTIFITVIIIQALVYHWGKT